MNPKVPQELERIVNKAVEKDLDLRYQSAAEMRSDLKRLRRETESGRSAAAFGAVSQGARKLRPAYIAVPLLVGAVLVAIALFAARAPLPPPRLLTAIQITVDNLPKDQLATDGPRIYFVETVNQRGVFSQVSAGGGDVSRIVTPFANTSLQDISPARSELLVGSFNGEESFITGLESPQWIIPVPAGSPRRLGDVLAAGSAWSRDGQQLAFSRGHDIYLAHSDGSEPHRLVTIAGNCFGLQFSPEVNDYAFGGVIPTCAIAVSGRSASTEVACTSYCRRVFIMIPGNAVAGGLPTARTTSSLSRARAAPIYGRFARRPVSFMAPVPIPSPSRLVHSPTPACCRPSPAITCS